MKKIHILSLLFLSATVILLSSCGSGHAYYAQPAPRYHTSLALIISPRPGFIMDRYPDGRYYYHSPEGYTYWRGGDNRFYLDRAYLNRGRYNQREYNEWNRYGQGNHRYRRHR
jgi:hypothetical protein